MTKPSDERHDPLLQHLIDLTRDGTVVAALEAAHEKFRRLHADALRLATTATTDDDRAVNELGRTLDDYAALFKEHHHAEDGYFFPALRQAEPELKGVVDQLAAQHEQLGEHLIVVIEQARLGQSGDGSVSGRDDLVKSLTELQAAVEEHLRFEETETIPALSAWTDWPIEAQQFNAATRTDAP